ncbi:MAG: hypothetical protein IKI60_04190 [Alloprevotella sp.]|nr:hypothetical protein [Alloprevotella sp.]
MNKIGQLISKGLSGNALKVIAIVAMTVDHLAWVNIETYEQAETPLLIFLHCIGRLTAPMMIFFVAEGYYHTRNYSRYLRRLFILALVSHFAFCYFNMSGYNPFDNLMFNATSIAWPLMWGLILLKVWDMEQLSRWMKVLITLLACLLTFSSDWSCAAPLAILMIGRSRGDFYKQMLWMMLIISLYAVAFYVVNNPTYGIVHLACWLAVPFLGLYNGQRGRCRWLGKFFYYYYPAHMALIGLLARLVAG